METGVACSDNGTSLSDLSKLPNITAGVFVADLCTVPDCEPARCGMCTPAPLLVQAGCIPAALDTLERLECVGCCEGGTIGVFAVVDGAEFVVDVAASATLLSIPLPCGPLTDPFELALPFSAGLEAVDVGTFEPCAALA